MFRYVWWHSMQQCHLVTKILLNRSKEVGKTKNAYNDSFCESMKSLLNEGKKCPVPYLRLWTCTAECRQNWTHQLLVSANQEQLHPRNAVITSRVMPACFILRAIWQCQGCLGHGHKQCEVSEVMLVLWYQSTMGCWKATLGNIQFPSCAHTLLPLCLFHVYFCISWCNV